MSNTLLAETARAILSEALNSPFGLVIEIQTPPSNPPTVAPTLRAKQILYRFKNENSDFSGIQIRLSPDDPDRELWLIKPQNETRL